MRFKIEYKSLIESHLGSIDKLRIDTFRRYKPHHISKTGVLTQFACDTCIKFDYLHCGLKSGSKNVHKCGTKLCSNYDPIMGDVCNCMFANSVKYINY